MLSRIQRPLINADCALSTKESITRLGHMARSSEIIFKEELIRLMGQKSTRLLGDSTSKDRAMLAQLICSTLALLK